MRDHGGGPGSARREERVGFFLEKVARPEKLRKEFLRQNKPPFPFDKLKLAFEAVRVGENRPAEQVEDGLVPGSEPFLAPEKLLEQCRDAPVLTSRSELAVVEEFLEQRERGIRI